MKIISLVAHDVTLDDKILEDNGNVKLTTGKLLEIYLSIAIL